MINIPSRLVFSMIFFMTSINILIWMTVHLYDGQTFFVNSIMSVYSHLDVALVVFLSLAYSKSRDPFAGVIGVVVYFIILDLSLGTYGSNSTAYTNLFFDTTTATLDLFYAIVAGTIVGVAFNLTSRSPGVSSGSVATIVSLLVAFLVGFGLRELVPVIMDMASSGSSKIGSILLLFQRIIEHPLVSMPYTHLYQDVLSVTSGAPLSSISYYNSVSYIMVLGFISGVLISSATVYTINRNYTFAIMSVFMLLAGLLTGISDAFELVLLVSAPLLYLVFIGVSFLFMYIVGLLDVQSAVVFAPDVVHYIALRSIFTNEIILIILAGVAALMGVGIYFVGYLFTKYRFLGVPSREYD